MKESTIPSKDSHITCMRCRRRLDISSYAIGSEAACPCGYRFVVPAPPLKAGRLDCPGCGAPVDVGLPSCPYCKAGLATVSCARCFGMNFRGARHCTHCGEKIDRVAVDPSRPSKLSCPRCKESLLFHIVSGCRLESCGQCGGVWIDHESLKQIYEGKEEKAAVGRMAFPHQRVEKARSSNRKITYIPCPVCQARMNRQNFAKLSGVVLDVCREHGTWFDAGEIRGCIEFVLSGGLVKAAAAEKDRMKEKVAHLEAMARHHSSSSRGSGFSTEGSFLGGEQELAENFLVSLLGTVLRFFA